MIWIKYCMKIDTCSLKSYWQKIEFLVNTLIWNIFALYSHDDFSQVQNKRSYGNSVMITKYAVGDLNLLSLLKQID